MHGEHARRWASGFHDASGVAQWLPGSSLKDCGNRAASSCSGGRQRKPVWPEAFVGSGLMIFSAPRSMPHAGVVSLRSCNSRIS
jgi:hypothetical protein